MHADGDNNKLHYYIRANKPNKIQAKKYSLQPQGCLQDRHRERHHRSVYIRERRHRGVYQTGTESGTTGVFTSERGTTGVFT